MIDLSGIIREIENDERILAAYLLGSAARGTMRADSDIDVALLPIAGRRLGSVEIFEMAARMSLACGREVDLGVLSSDNNLIYAAEAVYGGKRIFCRDEKAALERQATLLALFLDLKHCRREVEDAYRC
jgi:uncharacterized protein